LALDLGPLRRHRDFRLLTINRGVSFLSGWTIRIHRLGRAIVLAAAAAAWGCGIVVFGAASTLWLAVTGLVVAGAADMLSGVFRITLWNRTIPDSLRGRLASVELVSYTAGPLLGTPMQLPPPASSASARRWFSVAAFACWP
jgi:hypothetical protein